MTAAQAAARLGIKPATLYAYVSRGLIPRRRGPDGRTSLFAASDVERLAKRTPHSRLAPTDIVVPSSISLVDGAAGALFYRGVDATLASGRHRFEEVAEFLWTGRWNAADAWPADAATLRTAQRALRAVPRRASAAARLAVLVAAAGSAAGRGEGTLDAAITDGRNIMATVVDALPAIGSAAGDGFAARLWARSSGAEPSPADLRLLDDVLCVAAEHGVTLSVVAARIAAGSGADLYAAVTSALGPASAAIATSRFDALERLLREAERSGDPSTAVDEMIAREGRALGTSIEPYPKGDPRARFVLGKLTEISNDRAQTVLRVATQLRRRSKAEPDMSFATAAVAFVCDLAPGSSELITVVARTAGWIAHATSEYRQPTPFRPHATYVGVVPAPEQREPRELLYAVMEYLRED